MHKIKMVMTSALFAGVGVVSGFAQTKTTANNVNEKKDTLRVITLPHVDIHAQPMDKGYQALSKEKMENVSSSTLGEMLSKVPGIQNSWFGPNAGTPVIRSLSGNRVKVLNDGLASGDLSGISPDFNTPVDPDNASGMQVYKNSASVLYGGKAIGGAVNIETQLIPKQETRPVTGTAGIEGSYNNGARQFFSLNGGIGKHWSWHVGGSNRRVLRIRIPGNSKPSMAYDPKIVGFDSQLQSMAQMDVTTESVFNTSLYPYISRFALEHMEDYGLSEGDKYTFREQDTGYDEPNIKNPDYILGQDPNTPSYVQKVKDIKDYGPVKKGEMTNSHSRQSALYTGVVYTGRNFTVGAGYRCSYSYYGVPTYAQLPPIVDSHTHADGHQHTIVQEFPYEGINVRSLNNEVRLEAEVKAPAPFLQSARLQMQGLFTSDNELIGKASVSHLLAKQKTMRLELPQTELSFMDGLTGVDYAHRRIDGKGESRFLPDNFSSEWGLFTRQHLHNGFISAVLGYRHDYVRKAAYAGGGYVPGRGMAGGKLSARFFNMNQVDAEVKADLWKVAYLRAGFNHSERAPEVNELYAGNNHYAIAVEENGDDRLKKERANTMNVGMGFQYEGLTFSVDAYRSYFKDYIYLAHTGIARAGGFTVKEWRAADTRLSGLEATLSYKHDFGHWGIWEAGTYYDRVKNKNVSDDEMRRWSDGDYMPNMPVSRWGASLNAIVGAFSGNVAMDRYLKQKYLGKNINNEYAFPPYTLLNARLAYILPVHTFKTEFYLYGNNLLNQEARPQNSLLKYLAPLPGISVGAGLKVTI